MFHFGHIKILKRAKEQCDYLIVGVSTDQLAESYKRKPTFSLEQRMVIVEAIKFVDKVVVQTNLDKFAAWEHLRYNILFHGDDWKNSPLYNQAEKQLARVGVKTIFFPYTQGISSSLLREEHDKSPV